jgi:hypothetical protein
MHVRSQLDSLISRLGWPMVQFAEPIHGAPSGSWISAAGEPHTCFKQKPRAALNPGGNVTGIFVRENELAAKRVEIAREAFPRATLVGIVFDALSHEQGEAAAEAARKLGLEPLMIEVKGEQGYARAFGSLDNAPRAADHFARRRDIPARPRSHRASIARTPHSVDRGVPGEHGGWRADQLRL